MVRRAVAALGGLAVMGGILVGLAAPASAAPVSGQSWADPETVTHEQCIDGGGHAWEVFWEGGGLEWTCWGGTYDGDYLSD